MSSTRASQAPVPPNRERERLNQARHDLDIERIQLHIQSERLAEAEYVLDWYQKETQQNVKMFPPENEDSKAMVAGAVSRMRNYIKRLGVVVKIAELDVKDCEMEVRDCRSSLEKEERGV